MLLKFLYSQFIIEATFCNYELNIVNYIVPRNKKKYTYDVVKS